MTADAVGGVWTYALDLARALTPHGVTISLAVLGPSPSDAQRAEARALPNVRVYERPGRLEWMDEPWADVEDAGDWLLDLARTVDPDVVHLNGYAHAALPWCAPVLVVGHSCVLSWWRAVHAEDAPASWDRYATAVRAGLGAADLVVAPSAAMLSELVSCYGPLSRTRVIPNGRDIGWRVALTGKEPVILTVGRLWDEAKNVESVCAIARELPWPIYVAGDERGPDGGRATCENVHALGKLAPSEVRGWMARASIYASPARYEPFGLSVLEAAQAGCALVLGDIRSLREIWGDAALFVAPGNRRMLASAISRLIEDDAMRNALSERARARASAMTAARMAQRYADAYGDLIGGSVRTRPAETESVCEVRPVLSLGAV
jgi:glycosyltransferase involved in cell wall biosynthesis